MMRIAFWGTYDTGKPRVRILLRGLRENGIEILECHSEVWSGIEDKSQMSGRLAKVRLIFKWLLSYPWLLLRYLRLPRHDAVLVGYMGHFDVLVIWPFAKLRGVPMIWDAFLSLHNTAVEDRKLIGQRNPLAFMVYAWEWLACQAADMVLLDTKAHATYFAQRFNIPAKKTAASFVGAELEAFPAFQPSGGSDETNGKVKVLFYGQFIPLHGIETIVLAAQRMKNDPVEWILIGRGQEEGKIRAMLDRHALPNLKWIPWVPYEDLVEWIHKADVCLGVFGDSDKANRVIPNKVFQILASGKPLITRDSSAIRELLSPDMAGVFLVPPANPGALAEAICRFSKQRRSLQEQTLHRDLVHLIEPVAVTWELTKLMHDHLC